MRPRLEAAFGATVGGLMVLGAMAARAAIAPPRHTTPAARAATVGTATSAPAPPDCAPAQLASARLPAAPPPPLQPATGWSEVGGTPAPPAQNAGNLEVLAYSPTGVLLAGTQGGVWQYTSGRWAPMGDGLPTPMPPAVSLTFAPNGAPVVGLADGGIWELDGGRWTAVGGAASPIARDIPYALAFLPCSGTLLAATESGLWSYSGGPWTQVTGPGLPTGPYSVVSMAVSNAGTAIAVENLRNPTGDGVWRETEGAWHALPAPPVPWVSRLAFGPGGTLIAATTRGVWQYAGSTWSQVGGAASPLAGDLIQAMTFSPAGALTVAADPPLPGGDWGGGGVWRYDGGVWRPLGGAAGAALSMDAITALAYSPDGTLAASATLPGPTADCGAAGLSQSVAAAGVWTFHGGAWRVLPGGGDPLGTATTLLPDAGGSLTAATDEGVYRWSGQGWSRVGSDRGPLSFAFVTGLARSPSGGLAAAVSNLGPCRTSARVWLYQGTGWSDADAPAAMGTPEAAVYSGGTLYVGSGRSPRGGQGGGVWRYASGGWSEVGGPTSPLARAFVASLLLSPGAVITAGSDHGVWRYAAGVWSQLGGSGAPETGVVRALTTCPGGALVAGSDGGLWRFKGGAWQAIAGPPGGVTAVACANDGAILSGALGAGVWRTVGGTTARLGGDASPIAHDSVVSLALGADGTVYAGTNNYGVWAYRS